MEASENLPIGRKDITSNALKLMAITLMLWDHIVTGWLPQNTLLYFFLHIPGRVVAPIMCYMIAEGYHYTHDLKKYLGKLLLFAIPSHFLYLWYFYPRLWANPLNWWRATSVLWSLALGLAALAAVKKTNWHWGLRLAAVLACCFLAMTADWNFIAVLWIVNFGVFRENRKMQMIGFSLVGLLFYILPTVYRDGAAGFSSLGIFLAIPLLACYHGRRGRKSKSLQYAFYVFYPLHLFILALLKRVLLV